MLSKIRKLYKFSRPLKSIIYANITGKRIPIRLDLNVTKFCNLRCSYCYVDFDDLKNKPEIPASQWNQLLSDMYKRGTRAVRIMGGEPLIRDDIGLIIDHAVGLGMITELNTNGYFVKKRINELKKLDSLCISLDGDKEANDKLRGNGCHDRAIEAIEIAKREGIDVRIHGMVTNQTMDSLDYLAGLSKKYNISFTCAPCCLPNLKETRPDLYVDPDKTAEFYKRYLKFKREGYRILNSIPAIEHVIRWPFKDKFVYNLSDKWPPEANSYVRCQYGHLSCYIDADGMMYACSTQWKIGLNYFDEGFERCWDYLQKHLSCVTCNTINDFSYAFKLNPYIIFEVTKEILGFGR
ncbi:MAG: radical SAM protein [Candidatus Omnitrophota bacterium]